MSRSSKNTSNTSQKKQLEEVQLILNENGKIKTDANFYKVEVIAQLFGLSVRRIQQLTQEGILPTTTTTKGRRYDLVPTIQRYVKYLQDKSKGKAKSDKETELKEQKLEAEIALKESQNEIQIIKTQIYEGKYIPKEEVQLDYRRFFVVFKKFALSIPSRVTGFINGFVEPTQARKIESELNADIINLLSGFVIAGITPEETEMGKKGK